MQTTGKKIVTFIKTILDILAFLRYNLMYENLKNFFSCNAFIFEKVNNFKYRKNTDCPSKISNGRGKYGCTDFARRR